MKYMNNKLIYYGYNHDQIRPMVQNLCSQLGLEFHFEEIVRMVSPESLPSPTQRSPYRIFLTVCSNANIMCIWNGMHRYGPLLTDLCNSKAIPKFYIEYGMFTHRENIFVDPRGTCGDSILNHDVSWVTQEDMQALEAKRAAMQNWYEIGDEEYILVPLQIETDPQVLYYTKYKDMFDFVTDVVDMYPNNRILVKQHPMEIVFGSNFDSLRERWTKERPDSNIEFIGGTVDLLSVAAKASLVVSLTSTSLYEAGILGKPVVALGDHPLARKSIEEKEKILAGALALNVSMQTGSIKPILDRFGINPL